MEKLDRQLQRRVWARVYSSPWPALTGQQRQRLQRCLARSRENLRIYQAMTGHAIYAEAFDRLSRETKEQIKMLQQILG